jgi:hypothetical protein
MLRIPELSASFAQIARRVPPLQRLAAPVRE